MFDTVGGLPLHPLVVHATVVFVPLAALAVLLYGLWPAFRRRTGALMPALAVFAFLLVPLATQSGESLEDRVGEKPSVERHAEMGETMLPIMAVLVLAALALYWLARPGADGRPRRGGPLLIAAIVVATLASLTGLTQIMRIGHSGAESAWSAIVANTTGGQGGDD